MFIILVGRQFEDGIFWEIVWYSEEHNNFMTSQCKEPNWEEEGLVSRFDKTKAEQVTAKLNLKSRYDIVEIKKAVPEEQPKKKTFSDLTNEYLVLN